MWEIHENKGVIGPVASFIGEVPERFKISSPIELLPLNVEGILIHGELDRYVSVDSSIEYYHRAIEQGDKVRLIVLPEAEHFMVIDPSSSVWQSVIESLEK